MTKIVLFDEKSCDLIPGIINNKSFLDLPIWGNYRFRNFVNHIISQYADFGIEVSIAEWEGREKLADIMKNTNSKGIFISRVSSLVFSELGYFKKIEDGPVKLSINKIPTDFYYLPKNYFFDEFFKDLPHIKTVQDLFGRYLFERFVKIADRNGYSFLMRDGYEYYRENMKTLDYLKSNEILSIIGNLLSLSEVEAYIGGSVKDSYIAPGSKILGNVIDSVIFEGVEIGEGSHIESSVILPGNKIEEDVIIRNSLILEGASRFIRKGSRIGDFYDAQRSINRSINHSYHLKNGLTIVGEGVNIPEGSRIGAFCVIWGRGNPEKRVELDDGEYLFIESD